MTLRPYKEEDKYEIVQLFYNTVHTVNREHYTESELNAWASGAIDVAEWCAPLANSYTLVMEGDGVIVGFGNIEQTGYLDRLYVHHLHQRQGISSSIVAALEKWACQNNIPLVTVHASITAVPFFVKRNYHILHENFVTRGELRIKNYYMQKYL